MQLGLPAIPENKDAVVVSIPTAEALNKLQTVTKKKPHGAPKTTAFSSMSGFS